MIYWGKVVAGSLGYLSYGPLGLILGLIVGQLFDNGLTIVMRATDQGYASREIFFKTLFQVMGHLAKSDGRVSEQEIKVAREIMQRDFQLDRPQMLAAMRYFNQGKSPFYNLNAALAEFKKTCGNSPDLLRFFLELLVKAMLADQVLHQVTYSRLIFICGYLQIPLHELDYQLHSYKARTNGRKTHNYSYQKQTSPDTELTRAYQVFDLSPNCSDAELSKAYRKLISKYHPDKLMAKGVPEQMLKTAKQKTQELNAAYDLLTKSRAKA